MLTFINDARVSATGCGVLAQVIPVLLLAGILERRSLESAKGWPDAFDAAYGTLAGGIGEILAITGVDHGHHGFGAFWLYAAVFVTGFPVLLEGFGPLVQESFRHRDRRRRAGGTDDPQKD